MNPLPIWIMNQLNLKKIIFVELENQWRDNNWQYKERNVAAASVVVSVFGVVISTAGNATAAVTDYCCY